MSSGLNSQERLLKLEHNSEEAEKILRQLKTCIEVLEEKSRGGANGQQTSVEIAKLKEENLALKAEIECLKEVLITKELLNGIPQIPVLPSPQPLSMTAQPTDVAEPSGTSTDSKPIGSEKASTSTDSKPIGSEKASTSTDSKPTSLEKVGEPTGKGKSKEKKSKPMENTATPTARPVDVSRLDMRIGRIVDVKRHPDADTLYVEQIELGEERPRTVCSGLVKFIPIEEMQDRLLVVLCNLKPVKMRGVLSEAMVMCASTPEKVELIVPPEGCVPGDRITFEGYEGPPDAQLNPKKKIFEQVSPDLRTNDEGVACYRGIPFTVSGKGICVSTMKNVIIK